MQLPLELSTLSNQWTKGAPLCAGEERKLCVWHLEVKGHVEIFFFETVKKKTRKSVKSSQDLADLSLFWSDRHQQTVSEKGVKGEKKKSLHLFSMLWVVARLTLWSKCTVWENLHKYKSEGEQRQKRGEKLMQCIFFRPVGTLLCKCHPLRIFRVRVMIMVISFIICCTYELMRHLLKWLFPFSIIPARKV